MSCSFAYNTKQLHIRRPLNAVLKCILNSCSQDAFNVFDCRLQTTHKQAFGNQEKCQPGLRVKVHLHWTCTSYRLTCTGIWVNPLTGTVPDALMISVIHCDAKLPFDRPYAISYWWRFGTKPLSLTVSKIFNVKCNAMVDVTLMRPLNKGQGHSFWYQSISHIRLPIGCQ